MSIEPLEFYAFYGTLRRGMENHQAFATSLHYLDSSILKGYRMYSLVDYPYVVFTGNAYDSISIELFQITSAHTEQMIYQMEMEAGYILSTVVVNGNKFGLYIFPGVDPAHASVPQGDWVKYTHSGSF